MLLVAAYRGPDENELVNSADSGYNLRWEADEKWFINTDSLRPVLALSIVLGSGRQLDIH